jgi:hypothetical protein
VVDQKSTLSKEFLHVTVRNREAQIPTRGQDNLPVGAVPFRERTAPNVIVEPLIRLADRVPLIPRTNNGLGDVELEHIP